MKNILWFSILVCLISCNKESFLINEDEKSNSSDNFLRFDIKDISYGMVDTGTYSLNFKQVENQSFELLDLDKTARYLWFMPYDISEDTLSVIGKVSFELETDLDIPFKTIDMEFSFLEAKTKLHQLTDSTYKYKSMADFHALSHNSSWGEPYDGNAFEFENLLITVPEAVQISENYAHYISSNGFYFEDETINTSTSAFNVEEQSMIISGNFNVKIKELSCGFYMTHDVKNARFQVKIQ